MTDTSLYSSFAQWLEQILSAPLPEGIAAFNINLYGGPDSCQAELVACPTFDPDDPDWATEDILTSPQPLFDIPYGTGKDNDWEHGLELAGQWLARYLASQSAGARRLQAAEAVALGFVDGDLQLIWQQAS